MYTMCTIYTKYFVPGPKEVQSYINYNIIKLQTTLYTLYGLYRVLKYKVEYKVQYNLWCCRTEPRRVDGG